VLRWAADMAVGGKGCTKKLSAISFQLDQTPPRGGAFLLPLAPVVPLV
jgi:hypothetical protein